MSVTELSNHPSEALNVHFPQHFYHFFSHAHLNTVPDTVRLPALQLQSTPTQYRCCIRFQFSLLLVSLKLLLPLPLPLPLLLLLLLLQFKGKDLPLQAWTGPEGSRRLRLPDFKTIGT